MRPIHKATAPAALTSWLASLPAESVPGWREIPSDTKANLKDNLLREQGFLCCYCECRVDATHSHIEHLNPQSIDPNSRFAYANLMASCQGESQRRTVPSSCGLVRGNLPLPIHPLMQDCGKYFVFSSSGTIGPNEDPAKRAHALVAISTLKLDAARLVQARRAALSAINELLPMSDIRQIRQQARDLLRIYAEPDKEGRMEPFLSAIEQHLMVLLP